MAVVSRLELENAQRDVTDLGKIVNGPADLVNPGKAIGTVTTRQGGVVKTLAKLVADGADVVNGLLTPLVYPTIDSMNADKATLVQGVYKIKAGQTCYCRESTQIYILTSVLDANNVSVRTWEQVSDLAQAASAADYELLLKKTAVGRVSVDDFQFLTAYDRYHDKHALKTKFIKWPGKDTTGHGLAKVLNGSSQIGWPTAPWGQEGIDFGCPTEMLATLIPGANHPAWTTPGRILIKPDTASKIIDGYNVQGIIEVNSQVTEEVHIRNCVVDANYLYLTAVQPDGLAPVYMKRVTARNFIAQGHVFLNGVIDGCIFEGSKADGMKGVSTQMLVIHNTLVRQLGQIDPSAHADCFQIMMATGLRLYGSTLYMPGTGTAYDEGTYGSTQVLRLVTENAAYHLQDVIIAGNLIIGGGFTIAIRARQAGVKVHNVILANNLLGGPNYHLYGHITNEHTVDGGSIGSIKNLLLHNNIDLNGSPPTFNGISQNGLWHYDKSLATPEFLDLGKRWGYLDWNGDPAPGIANRSLIDSDPGLVP